MRMIFTAYNYTRIILTKLHKTYFAIDSVSNSLKGFDPL